MAMPKKKMTRARTGNRRSHLTLKLKSLAFCAHCKASIVPHRVCPHCGYYRGREVIKMSGKK